MLPYGVMACPQAPPDRWHTGRMRHESLGFTGHHRVETYCPGCGNPESSGEHGMDCPQFKMPA